MKQQPMTGYRPNYPRKALQGAALTAAALVAMSGLAGCRKVKEPELQTDGMVAVETPAEELVLDGEVAIEEPTATPGVLVTLAPEALTLDGEVAIPELPEDELPEDEISAREAPLVTTGVLLMPTATPAH